jgi:hypothetical protein
MLVKEVNRPMCVFGAVPPPEKLGDDVALKSCENLAKTFLELQPDAVIVYDIQDEKSRNGSERPFPFSKTFCPRRFAKALSEKTNLETIVYQALTEERTADNFHFYMQETLQEYGLRNLVFVGGGSNAPLTVPEASAIALRLSSDEVMLGGVTIPERHRDRKNEHQRISEKCESGVSFFTSQVVYNPDNVIAMMRDYAELCRTQNRTPARILLAFAPFGRRGTLDFLRWLGVEVAEGTAERVLSRGSTAACLEESVQICWENLRRILDAYRRLRLDIPLGIAVESVSKFRDEQKAAEDLFKILRAEIDSFFLTNSA